MVEVMGGVEPAYTFVKRALESGRSVCTSNKELVAKHGTGTDGDCRGRSVAISFLRPAVGAEFPLSGR